MDISFLSKEIPIYREYDRQARRTQESVECVVPDTDADIGKIAAVQSEVFLKSKDLSARGVLVTGELAASVLYIRDGSEGITALAIRKPFSLEFELEEPESDTLSQIALFLQGTDVRVINPRKISLAFEAEGVLHSYRREKLRVESALPDNTPGLHARIEAQTLTVPCAVCEKSLAVNEQFGFSQQSPAVLLAEKAALSVTDCQLIGTKAIVKGSAEIRVTAAAAEGAVPFVSVFTAPFSQILEVGVESMSHCLIRPEITGAYYDLVDAINGEKALDVELHAVLQLVCCEKQEIRCITDAYSNLMPAQLLCRTEEYRETGAAETRTLSAREKLSLTEQCRELLHSFASVSRVSAEAGKLTASVNLDFLYLNAEGRLAACRRSLALSQDAAPEELRIVGIGALQTELSAEGEQVSCSVSLELRCALERKKEISMVDGIMLDEERLYCQDALPTLTLVRREGESIWNLAKRYHSSEALILDRNANPDDAGRMLMIPKCI